MGDDTPPVADAKNAKPLRLVLIVLAVLAGVALLFSLLPVATWLDSFQEYVRGLGRTGWVVYALAYAVCVVFFVPASVLTLGAGAIYGLGLGVAIVLVGASLGAIASFFLARTFLRSRIQRMVAGNPRFEALDRAIAREGAKIVLLVRLAPVFPFTYSNYAFGLTGIGAGAYSLATVVGMAPGTFAYVYLGAAAADAAVGGHADWAQTVLQVLGALAALVVTIFVARLATRAIREAGVDS